MALIRAKPSVTGKQASQRQQNISIAVSTATIKHILNSENNSNSIANFGYISNEFLRQRYKSWSRRDFLLIPKANDENTSTKP